MTTRLWLYEHADGRHLVTYPGAAILAGDPQWVRVGPVEVQGDYNDLLSIVGDIVNEGHLNTEDLARLRQHLASAKKDAPSVPAAEAVTDAMIGAYLSANNAYWVRTDQMPPAPGRVRAGNVKDATRESLRAALSAAPPATDEDAAIAHGVKP